MAGHGRSSVCCLFFLLLSWAASLAVGEHSIHTRSLGALELRAVEHLAEDIGRPHASPSWGPLSSHALYVHSLAPPAQEPARQQHLLSGLHARASVVTSFLPPYAFVVLASPDGAAWLRQQPDTLTVPYPPALKIAPEWQPLLDLIAANDTLSLQHIARGKPLARPPASDDSTPFSRTHEDGADPAPELGQLRMHDARRRHSSTHSSSSSSSSTGGGTDGAWGQDGPRHFLVSVSFPDLSANAAEVLLGGPQQQEQQEQPPPPQQQRAVFSPALAAATDWQEALHQVARGCGAELLVEHGTLLVAACAEDLASVLSWLAAQPSVNWLSPHFLSQLHNRAAAAVVQSGGLSDGGSDPDMFPFWQAGLDGTGQIIGCGDTGINMESCYFSDPSVDFRANDRRGDFRAFSSSNHRKVALYVALRGDMNDADGHGSHVAGTLAGSRRGSSPVTSSDEGTGMAPKARLAFLDLAQGGVDGVVTPSDLGRSYFSIGYEEGARVHSDSWGSTQSSYDSTARSTDRFLWENQDFLSVFSAGNQGDRTGSSVSSTLSSPSVAKNVISVGATLSQGNRVSSSPVTALQIEVSIPASGTSAEPFVRKTLVVQADMGGKLSSLKSRGSIRLAVAEPLNACSAFSNPSSISGKVVLADRGDCQLSEKLERAANAGAAALIIINDRSSGFFEMSGSSGRSTPLGGVSKSVGRYMKQAAQEDGSVAFFDRPSHSSPLDQLAAFSSFGPTPDGRIKPDIVAPGILSSAASNDGCSTRRMQGTSMAAPVVGGSAAIVRQYFIDGFYPSGSRTEGDAYQNPSGALVKAVLLAGASPLRGNVELANDVHGGLPLDDAPSSRQGYGRVDLSRSLPLKDEEPGWRLQVIDKAKIQEGQTHKYCARALGGPFRVVLAWHDYPGDPAAGTALVSNLDLELRAAGIGGLRLLGNGKEDSTNNVESVLLESLPQGNVAISVTGKRVPSVASPQSYSLVVLGVFSGILQGPNNPVGGGDSRNETCVITLAQIDRVQSSDSLTDNNDLFFVFRTESGVEAPSGFECRLLDEEAVANNKTGQDLITFTNQLHSWEACTSPQEYMDMPDHTYLFQVRSAGEDVSDSLKVQVDTMPPVTTLEAVPALSSSGQTETPVDSITFNFTAEDASPVEFECSIILTEGPDPPFFRTLPASLQLGSKEPCTSPAQLRGLYHGTWLFKVTGTDAAGNVEGDSEQNQRNWKQRYAEGTAFTRLAASPPPLTNEPRLTFRVYSFTGKGDDPPSIRQSDTPSSYIFSFNETSNMTSSSGSSSTTRGFGSSGGLGSNFIGAVFGRVGGRRLAANTSQGEDNTVVFVEEAPRDGDWVFSARLDDSALNGDDFGADSDVSTIVHVDTTPPIIDIIEQPANPPNFQTSTPVRVQYGTKNDDDVVRFGCRWLRSSESAPDPSNADVDFEECEDYEFEPGILLKDVTEGFWLLQINGTDRAGNIGEPTDVSFQVDLGPPELANLDAPSATKDHTLEIAFQLDDGPGSGVDPDKVVCTFAQRQAVPDAAPAPDDIGSEYKPVDGLQQKPCPNPAKYKVTEGRYVFSLEAEDLAGLVMEREHTVTVDMRAPLSKIDTPTTSNAKPSEVTLKFTSTDFPEGSESGVAQHECLLQEGSRSGRRLLQGAPRIANGPNVKFGEWQECEGRSTDRRNSLNGLTASEDVSAQTMAKDTASVSTTVTYQRLRSGEYSFQVRPTDAAGNKGNASDPYTFTVDETIGDPDDGGGGDISDLSDRTGLTEAQIIIIIIVVICVGVVSLLCIIVMIIVAARRRRGRSHAPVYTIPAGTSPGPYPPPGAYAFGPRYPPYSPYPQPLYVADRHQAQLQREEEDRIAQALAISEQEAREQESLRLRAEEQERTARALELSAEQAQREGEATRLRQADEERLAQAMSESQAQAQRDQAVRQRWQEEARVARAMQVSLEEENLRKAIEASLQGSRRP